MPDSVMCRAGHDATYALMGGWCEICSVRYAIRSDPALVDMDVGGEVVEPEADSPVFVVEARERFESWAETFDSTTVEGDVFSTAGEDQPFMESKLPNPPTRPDLSEVLLPWLTDPVVSERRCGFGEDSTWVVMIGVRSSESYEIGLTSQCTRKFSPRTELYGLQGLPRCEQRVGG